MTVQNHIHLSKTLGGAPENAPDVKWVVTDYVPAPVVIATHRRTLNGKLRLHRLRLSNGDVARFEDLQYTVKVSDYGGHTMAERKQLLEAMHGEVVYLVDHYHVDDGQDHTPYVKSYYVASVSPLEKLHTGITHFYVGIKLVDNSET